MKRLVNICGFLLACLGQELVLAQDEPQFSQYMAAPVLFNPGAAGCDPSWNTSLFFRTQWVELPGAPKSQLLTSELPVYKIGGGLALKVLNDRAGQQQTTQASIGYSWHKQFKKSVLGIGGYAGISARSLDGSRLIAPQGSYEDLIDHNDDQLPVTLESDLIPDAGAGVYWAGDRLRAGLSVTHLLSNYFSFTTEVGTGSLQYQPNGYVFLSWKAVNGEDFQLLPNVLLKTDLTEHMIDLNVLMTYRNAIMAGVSLRTFTSQQTDALVAMGGWNFSDHWGIRYSYDINISELNNANSGSHEVVLTYTYPIARPRAGKEINNLRYLYY